MEGRYFGTVNDLTGSNRTNIITINDNYVDGISLTFGNTSHRTHIWTFSASKENYCINLPQYASLMS